MITCGTQIVSGASGATTTVAAADITDASASGISVLTGTAADGRLALAPYTAEALTGTGWTYSTGLGGTAAVSGGSIALTTDVGPDSFGRAGLLGVGLLAFEVRARISVATTMTTSAHILAVTLASALALTTHVGVIVLGDGTAYAARDGGGTSGAAVTLAGVLGGQGWVRIVVRGGNCLAYVGVGSGGAPPADADWRGVGAVDRGADSAPWSGIVAQLYTTSGACAATLTSLSYRVIA